jgi:hypothetical protein
MEQKTKVYPKLVGVSRYKNGRMSFIFDIFNRYRFNIEKDPNTSGLEGTSPWELATGKMLRKFDIPRWRDVYHTAYEMAGRELKKIRERNQLELFS